MARAISDKFCAPSIILVRAVNLRNNRVGACNARMSRRVTSLAGLLDKMRLAGRVVIAANIDSMNPSERIQPQATRTQPCRDISSALPFVALALALLALIGAYSATNGRRAGSSVGVEKKAEEEFGGKNYTIGLSARHERALLILSNRLNSVSGLCNGVPSAECNRQRRAKLDRRAEL